MNADPIRSKGESTTVALRTLRLDTDNPRLSAESRSMDQDDLAVSLELGFEAFTVAQSIASHGFFGSEPLIVVASDVADEWIVVEGNRRLTALKGLADANLRSQFAGSEMWEPLAAQARLSLDSLIPVVVLSSRDDATPIIGFRHISGILQWEPYAQARYIARLVDEDGLTFTGVAETIGVDKTRVGNLYRDQAIVQQAQALGIDTGLVERTFSLMTVAMGTPKLRNHVGADLGSRLVPGHDPVPGEKLSELREVITWLYGDGETEPVIGESRDISKLGNIVASEIGLKALRDGETLDLALQRVKDAGVDPRHRLISRLRAGRNALTGALEDLPDLVDDDEVRDLVEEVRAATDGLESALDDG